MKVFISWSGDLSKQIALELYDWLPMVVQSMQPYMSSESIDKGTRWASSIANELEGTSVGIIVLTNDNKTAPWINFEAGALAKMVGDAMLAPVIFGLKPSEVGSPLSQFQVTQFDKADMLRLLKSINSCAGDESLPEARLERMHLALWGQIESKIQPLLTASSDPTPLVRNETSEDATSKALEEILTLVRQQAHSVMNPERFFTPDVVRQVVESAQQPTLDAQALEMVQDYVSRIYRLWQSISQNLVPSNVGDEAMETQLRSQLLEFDRLFRRALGISPDKGSHSARGASSMRTSTDTRLAELRKEKLTGF